MTRTTASPILHLIRRVAEDQRLKDLPDQELLRHFLTGYDKTAFDALLRRHGPMVLDVCRNVLGNEQDAEDAFQATFLVLAQKAAAIRKKSSVGSWLYGVAYRTAINARACVAKRRQRKARSRRTSVAPDDITWREVQELLHAELNRLPERHRAPLVHCYLEGKSQDEAARLLGVSRAALKKRLEVGRALLRTRLVRQGLGPAAVLAVSAWPSAKASALVPVVLADSTVKAAALIGAGEAAKGVISPKVLALTEGVLKAMFLTKLKLVAAVALAVSVCAGLAGWSHRAAAQTQYPSDQPRQAAQGERPARRAAHPVADELDALRLEIDALRKEVRADRERIKALEAEVRGRSEQPANLYQNQRGEYRNRMLQAYAEADKQNQPLQAYTDQPGNKALQSYADQKRNPYAGADKQNLQSYADQKRNPYAGAEKSEQPGQPDHFAEAEAALKRLRRNPHDKQAADALDKAARRLKAGASREGKPGRASNGQE